MRTLRLSGGSVAAGVGVDWASGTLTYQGKHYPVSVKGLSVGDVGVTSIEASGTRQKALALNLDCPTSSGGRTF